MRESEREFKVGTNKIIFYINIKKAENNFVKKLSFGILPIKFKYFCMVRKLLLVRFLRKVFSKKLRTSSIITQYVIDTGMT